MGCTQSKIENEEAVSRCKERKQFMKESVTSRNAFAAAHSSYAIYLKNTGAALSDYAQGEIVAPHPAQIPAHQPNLASAAGVGVPAPPPFVDNLPPPPPPLPKFSTSPLQRAASMPEIKPDPPKPRTKSKPKPIIEEDEDEDDEVIESSESLRRRSRSSRSKKGVVENGDHDLDGPPPVASPSPPVSVESRTVPPLPQHRDTPYDYFFSVEDMPAPTLADAEEIEPKVYDERPKIVENEEEEEVFEERPERVEKYEEEEVEVEVERSAKVEEVVVAPPLPVVDEVGAGSVGKSLKKAKAAAPKGSANLLQKFAEIDDHFLKASESAHDVSKMLEATRLHYHSNFADNRGHIDHSARVMRVITWNRSFRGIPNVDDGKDDFDSEEHETHARVLDKLLAWEKKLYDEVKAGELMKFEYQKKVASLNRLKKRGNSEASEKAKAAVSHLHTRYIVDMQSMDSTVSEINSLRDRQLYPKLVQLVEGMATMWEVMRDHHEAQSKIVTVLRSFDISHCPKQTSQHHHERTIQLLGVVQGWHSEIGKLVTYQKVYIKALNNWLKLNLIPIESSLKEKVSSPPRIQRPPIQALLLAWQDHLEKLPDDVARTAIHNFGAVISTIVTHQEDEIKMKDKCEETRKELARKTRHFEDWYNKNMHKTIPDEIDPDGPEGHTRNDVVAEKQFAVETVKKRLEEEEETYERLCIQVREKSIASLKSRLPELFRALSDFASSCSEMYRSLIPRSPHNPSQSSARE
ncbi:uncharacterized protein LOC110769532 [Prunus avium]|uniref:Uncharacterized protein LOC110769532 n=1 Tax=Prunus avium TaxID=42229 RepID=A0A6P5TQB3_PRUAV|nr:uncharacterized protein LOC110769532 [Prunus avium]